MSITGELREYTKHYSVAGSKKDTMLSSIADRIDAEHQKAIRELNNLSDTSMLLPVDANGETIHVGDEMEGVDKYDSLKKVMGKVITVSFESNGVVDVAVQVWDSDGKSWHRAYLDPDASVYRHDHKPTVEDVMVEFATDWECAQDGEDKTAVLKEYASKLRLANSEE
jgi:hypothetical protein